MGTLPRDLITLQFRTRKGILSASLPVSSIPVWGLRTLLSSKWSMWLMHSCIKRMATWKSYQSQRHPATDCAHTAWGGLFPLWDTGEKLLTFGKGIKFRVKINRDRRRWIERELPLFGVINTGSQTWMSLRTTFGVLSSPTWNEPWLIKSGSLGGGAIPSLRYPGESNKQRWEPWLEHTRYCTRHFT